MSRLKAMILSLLLLLLLPAAEVFAIDPPGTYVDQVTNLFAQHHWAKGKEILDEALDYYPNDANLHYLAGRYWWNGKNYDKSRYHLVKACQINYDHIDAKTLLVSVEEITENFSSAICYVNELLEVSPYSKTLWLRKVQLYKKLGNIQAANNLLRRLSIIYPNDAAVSSEFYSVLETTYLQARRNGNMNEAETTLREMVRINPNDPDYQLAYANMLIQKGQLNDAMDALTFALNNNPGNIDIIKKNVSLLMETGRNMGALTLVRGQMAISPSPELTQLYTDLLARSARMESDSDPYQLYAKLYDQERSMEALQYLVSESVKRGYNEEALGFIAEMRRRSGDAPRWYSLEYEVYTKMGRTGDAQRAIERAAERFPSDYDVNLTLSRLRLSEALEAMQESRWTDAAKSLEQVRTTTMIPEYREAAIRRLFLCYRESGRYEQAEAMLTERISFEPSYRIALDRAALAGKQGQSERELDLLYASYATETDSMGRDYLRAAFQEAAVPFLRSAREEGANPKVVAVCDILLEMDPRDYWALRYATQAAKKPEYYLDAALSIYPDDPFFRVKKASALVAADRPEEAIHLLEPIVEDYPGDESLQGAYAVALAARAEQHRKAGDLKEAGALLDQALSVHPDDSELRYQRGVIYEKQHVYDSAVVYQSAYRPGVLEEKEYVARMEALQNRCFRNTADAGLEWLRFLDSDHVNMIGTAGFARRLSTKSTLSARLNYTGRDAEWSDATNTFASDGGRGFQLFAGYTYEFSPRWTASGELGYGNSYFPHLTLNATATRHLKKDWDLEGGLLYRRLQDDGNMLGVTVMGARTLEYFYFSSKLTLGVLHEHVFFNLSGRVRFYPYSGGRFYVEAQAGAGSAPELNFLTYYYNSTVFDHANSFYALGLRYPFNERLALAANATWNTLYDQRSSVHYRNLFIGNVLFTISF